MACPPFRVLSVVIVTYALSSATLLHAYFAYTKIQMSSPISLDYLNVYVHELRPDAKDFEPPWNITWNNDKRFWSEFGNAFGHMTIINETDPEKGLLAQVPATTLTELEKEKYWLNVRTKQQIGALKPAVLVPSVRGCHYLKVSRHPHISCVPHVISRTILGQEVFGSAYGEGFHEAFAAASAAILYIVYIIVNWRLVRLDVSSIANCKKLLQAFFNVLRSTTASDMRGEVRHECSKNQCQVGKWFAVCTCPICLLLLAVIVTRIWTGPSYTMNTNLLDSEVVPMTLAVAALIGLHSAATPKTLNCFNVTFSAIWIWKLCTVPGEWYTYWTSLIWPMRVIQGLVAGSPLLTFCLQSGITIVDVLAFNAHDINNKCHRAFPSAFNQFKGKDCNLVRYSREQFGYILTQAFLTFLTIAIQWAFQNLRMSQAHALIVAKRSDLASSLAQSLLSSMCDAVVTLDEALVIKEPCPKLASLLLRSGTDMQGKPLCDIVANADRCNFEETLRRAAEMYATREDRSVMHAKVMHLGIIGANQVAFPVEVFTSCMADADGAIFHIVGIKEDAERDVIETLPALAHGNAHGSIPEFSVVTPLNDTSYCSSIRSYETRSESSASHKSLSSDGEDMCIWVDASASELTFLHCSQSFILLSGASPLGAGFAQWLHGENLQVLREMLSRASTPQDPMRLALKPPGSRIKYSALARVERDDGDSGAHDVSMCASSHEVVCIQFSDVCLRGKHDTEKKKKHVSKITVCVFEPTIFILERHKCAKHLSRLLPKRGGLADILAEPELLVEALSSAVTAYVTDRESTDLPKSLGAFAKKRFDAKLASSLAPKLEVGIDEIKQNKKQRSAPRWEATLSLVVNLQAEVTREASCESVVSEERMPLGKIVL